MHAVSKSPITPSGNPKKSGNPPAPSAEAGFGEPQNCINEMGTAQHLPREEQAAPGQMYSLQDTNQNPLTNDETTTTDLQEKDQAASLQMNSLQDSTNTSASATTSTNSDPSKKKSKARTSQHPTPVLKSAKQSLKKIRRLGYSNFNDLPFAYWEPRLLYESKEEYDKRRLREGIALGKFITQEKAKAISNGTYPVNGANEPPSPPSRTKTPVSSPLVVLPKLAIGIETPKRKADKELSPIHSNKMNTKLQVSTDTTHQSASASMLKLEAEIKKLKESAKKEQSKHHAEMEKLKITIKNQQKEIDNLKKKSAQMQPASNKQTSNAPAMNSPLSTGAASLPPSAQKLDITLQPPSQSNSAPVTAASMDAGEGEPAKDNPLAPEIVNAIQQLLEPLLKSLDPAAYHRQKGSQFFNKQQNRKQTNKPSNQPGKQHGQRNEQQTPAAPLDDALATPGTSKGNTETGTSGHVPVLPSTEPNIQDPAAFPALPPPNFQVQKRERKRLRRLAAQSQQTVQSNTAKETTNNQKKGKKKNKNKLPRTQKQDPKSVLLLPSNDHPNIFQKLQNIPAANPRELGVRKHLEFPSGAVLVSCTNTEQATRLRKIAAEAGLKPKTIKERLPEIRIHGVPESTTVEELTQDITQEFKTAPLCITFVPYTTQARAGSKLAIVNTTMELKQKMSRRRTLHIGWSRCQIDSRIYIKRCSKCHLLGHSPNKCPSSAGNTAPTATDPCLDCSAYNELQQKLGCDRPQTKPKHRGVDHPTGSKLCPTLFALRKKALPTCSVDGSRANNNANG